MLKLLINLFIKDKENISDPEVRRAYGSLCGVYGIFLNLLLFAGKYFAGIICGSVAIVADAFNNLSDAGSSLISLFGFVFAGKKPDAYHPYGHGRIEYLAGLLISCIIVVMGFELARSSFEKILSPQAVEAAVLPAAILLVSVIVKLYMCLYNRSIGIKINSSAMKATAIDSLSDTFSTTVVLISMAASHFLQLEIDGYAGFVVALFIMLSGIKSAKDTISPLLGQAPDAEFVKSIEDTVLAYPEIIGIHDLVVHDYGPSRRMISLHAEVRGDGDMFLLHDVIDSAEMEIKDRFGCVATIHMDPIEASDSETAKSKQEISEKLLEIDPSITIHDFRMVSGPTHTKLIFDAVVPADFHLSDDVLNYKICHLIHFTWPDRYAVVTIDHSLT